MSSTNRGGQRSEADNYPTPAWCVHRLLEACPLPSGRWLEPAAGEGAIIRAVNEHFATTWPDVVVEWSANDIRKVRPIVSKHTTGDFLEWPGTVNGPHEFAVCITNPPYSRAQEFIEQAMYHADTVAMLLRLNYLGSEARAQFWRSWPPDVYVLPNRPAFVNGKTDSCEYAWFVWTSGARRSAGSLRVLATTPKEQRKETSRG